MSSCNKCLYCDICDKASGDGVCEDFYYYLADDMAPSAECMDYLNYENYKKEYHSYLEEFYDGE